MSVGMESDSAGLAHPGLASVNTARLTVKRAEAIKVLKAQLEKGLEIKGAKIRYVPELERAREAKGEWTISTMEVLRKIFNTDAVADECQNWVGKVLPEYADLNLFIEHFYDEMDQRLRKLHAVLKQVQALPDDKGGGAKPISSGYSGGGGVTIMSGGGIVSGGSYGPGTSTLASPAPDPLPLGGSTLSQGSTLGSSSSLGSSSLGSSSLGGLGASRDESFSSARGVASYPTLSQPSITMPTSSSSGGGTASAGPTGSKRCGAVIAYDEDPEAQQEVTKFVTRLGFECTLVKEAPGKSNKNGGALVEKLDSNQRLDFGLILSAPDALPKPFDLGYCVGKLGLKRIFVLSAQCDKVFVDEHGLLHIPLDPAQGWQLHLARQFKRVGLEVDLNRVF